jgi:hypothetical protein
VTLATVKKHVGHILGKLAAANRTQAVARARVLGLLRLGRHRLPVIRMGYQPAAAADSTPESTFG